MSLGRTDLLGPVYNPRRRRFSKRKFREKLKYARWMRMHPTPTEKRMLHLIWDVAYAKKPICKFVTQWVLLGYIVDFFCPQLHLVIEVDGAVHNHTQKRDKMRDSHLEDAGLYVKHFSNAEVWEEPEIIKSKISNAIDYLRDHLSLREKLKWL